MSNLEVPLVPERHMTALSLARGQAQTQIGAREPRVA